MPRWTLFGAAALLLTAGFVWLARSSATSIGDALDAREDPERPRHPAAAVLESDRLLAANVLVSHGLLLLLGLGTVWFTRVPLSALGVARPSVRTLLLGLAVGLVLAAGNEASARVAERLGLSRDERLRALLAPDGPAGWLGLLLVVLPLVATAEELLFRAFLVGGLSAGFDLPVWGLAVLSSLAFGAGHVLQGEAGVAVTAGLGFALAAAFVLSGSLTVAIVAHLVVHAVEFVVNERPGV